MCLSFQISDSQALVGVEEELQALNFDYEDDAVYLEKVKVKIENYCQKSDKFYLLDAEMNPFLCYSLYGPMVSNIPCILIYC